MIPRHFLLVGGLCLTVCAAAHGQAKQLSFEAAWDRVKTESDQLAAARAAVETKTLQHQALRKLGGPTVSLSGAFYAYNANLHVDLDPINQRLVQIDQRLPVPLDSLPLPLPVQDFPSSYTFNRHNTGTTRSISGVWPIYMGGAAEAARGFVAAQESEARADADKTGYELATLLVQRYFGAQLAARAATLRLAAQKAIQQHDEAAAKMLAAGVIARVERLQALVAFDEAKRNAAKAQDDAELAAIALARTVKSDTPVTPDTALFVLTQPIEPLPHFLNEALLRHPGLAKVNAKKAQAEQLHQGGEALRKPRVFAFGQRELKPGSANWVAGVGVRWTIYEALDRRALDAASAKQIEQVERTEQQARGDIGLLVEKNWRGVEQARRQFLSTGSSVALSQEVLRLRAAGLRGGTGTALELISAEVNHAKAETERAQAAYEYVMALARLLESCGLSEEFSAYVRRADVRIQ